MTGFDETELPDDEPSVDETPADASDRGTDTDHEDEAPRGQYGPTADYGDA